MQQPTSPDVIPKDHDWHMLVVKKGRIYMATIGHYNGQTWVLGDTKQPIPAHVIMYDAVPRMKNLVGLPVDNVQGMMFICEAILEDWRDEYESRAKGYRNQNDAEKRKFKERMEEDFPTWILAGADKRAAIDSILEKIRA